MSVTDLPSPEERSDMIESAAMDFHDAPGIEVDVWCSYGEEYPHPNGIDKGMIWKPANVTVTGDFTDPATLQVLSSLMDKHNLKVHVARGDVPVCEKSRDGHARLVLDREAIEGGA